MDKKPRLNDLLRLFHISAVHFMLIGIALDVELDDLLPIPGQDLNNLMIVFKRWIESNKGVTWRNALQVCEDFPDEFGRVKADLDKFLESDRAIQNYLNGNNIIIIHVHVHVMFFFDGYKYRMENLNFKVLPIYPNILTGEKEILAFLDLTCHIGIRKLPSLKIYQIPMHFNLTKEKLERLFIRNNDCTCH